MDEKSASDFQKHYQQHLKHLKLKGLQPKTIDAYARAIRRIGARYEYRIDDLSEAQLTDYFTELIGTHSWSAVKLDLYGLKFYTEHVLKQPWVAPGLIKPPKSQRLPDIVTVDEARRIFAAIPVASRPSSSPNRLPSTPIPTISKSPPSIFWQTTWRRPASAPTG